MKSYTRFKRTYGNKPLFFSNALGFLCLLFLLLSTQAYAETHKTDSNEARKLTEPESWVLVQTEQGKRGRPGKEVCRG